MVARDKARLSLILPILVTASAASVMSTDLYIPSLPHLTTALDASEQLVQLTITANVLMFGAAQLLHGPLSDRYGRRPVLIAGLVLFIVSSIACALATSVEQLIAARVLQGFSAAVEAVVGLAVVRDLFDGADRVRAYAIWGIAIAIVPGAAPIVGGYVHILLGWRANFAFTAVAGLVAAWLVIRWLPESTTPERGAAHPARMLRDYTRLFTDAAFLRHTLLLGCSMGVIYAFVTTGPFLVIERYGVATERFGYCQAAIVAAFLLGSALTDRLVRTMVPTRVLAYGALCAGIGAASLPVLLSPGLEGPITLTAGMSLVALGLGPVFAVAPAEALEIAPTRAGSAAAAIGAMEMGIGGLAAAAVTALHDGTPNPLVITVIGLLVVAMLAWRSGRRARPRPTPDDI